MLGVIKASKCLSYYPKWGTPHIIQVYFDRIDLLCGVTISNYPDQVIVSCIGILQVKDPITL